FCICRYPCPRPRRRRRCRVSSGAVHPGPAGSVVARELTAVDSDAGLRRFIAPACHVIVTVARDNVGCSNARDRQMNIRRYVATFLGVTFVGFGLEAQAIDSTGAGGTFPYPLHAKWSAAYKHNTAVRLTDQSN